MPSRKALLVGAGSYGEGFNDLPAVSRDLAVMEDALRGRGFETEILDESSTASASDLDRKIRDFVRAGDNDDVRIVYFTGHGITVQGIDCIVPRGTSRREAIESPTQRVSTDLSNTVDDSNTGLVIFVIDACRDPQDSPTVKSGSEGWGDPERLANPNLPRFIRFFGCGPGNVCHVLSPAKEEADVSVFSQSLANVLARRGESFSLRDLLERTDEECKRLATQGRVRLERQVPRLRYGEQAPGVSQLLEWKIFESASVLTDDNAGVSVGWPEFTRERLHCLTVLSEGSGGPWSLDDMVTGVFSSERGRDIWEQFRNYWRGHRVLDEGRGSGLRELPESLSSDALALASFRVENAFSTWARLDNAVRLVVEADLAVFDVTGFQPAVLLLMGIRAATRRGVTIASHGGGWMEGTPLERPFNLNDLSLNCHTPFGEIVGENLAQARLANRIYTGFSQMSNQPSYLDLPVFDALRRLGPKYEASSTISGKELLLVMCSYEKPYQPNWTELKKWLSQARFANNLSSRVERLQDVATPQLVSQALYEHLRRTAHCIVDWTGYSPSTFFELGVRLAVSPWGALQVVDVESLPDETGGVRRKPIEDAAAPSRRDPANIREQVAGMQSLFDPIVYHLPEMETAAVSAVETLLKRNPDKDADAKSGYARPHQIARSAMSRVQERHSSIEGELEEQADGFHQPGQVDKNAPQVLFYQETAIKRDYERAALERRLAAWLYLEHRAGAGNLPPGHKQRRRWLDLGRIVLSVLFESEDDRDLNLAISIEARIKPHLSETSDPRALAVLERSKGDALRRRDRDEEASAAYEEALNLFDQARARLHEDAVEVFEAGRRGAVDDRLRDEAIEVLGARGGILRRLARTDDALESYREGAEIERRLGATSTYNRTNAIKLSLLSKTESLAALKPEIEALSADIDRILKEDQRAADQAWNWADLGDCHALLGDADGASAAYETFMAKAETRSPDTTLEVVGQLEAALREAGDPEAEAVGRTIASIRSRLLARQE